MNQFFNADLVTLRTLLTNEYNPNDRGKNYYIPLYQREYNWDNKEILKLFSDIYEVCEDNTFESYFLGGVVLSRTSMEGVERGENSLEVIDGQQRLTTLSILIALIIQCLKFENRKYPNKEDYIKSMIESLTSYIITKRFDEEYQPVWVLKVERSDLLQDFYHQMINKLLEEKLVYTQYKHLTGEEKEFFLKIKSLHQRVKKLKDNELLHFTLQLLDHTQIVITKTDSFETGYLVFEKLNDSGKNLEAHELLKNYLFSIKRNNNSMSKEELYKLNQDETNKLKDSWGQLISTIDKIEPNLSPKTFLEYYLITIGRNYKNASTTHIFKEHRDYFKENISNRLIILEKMNKMINKLYELKQSNYSDRTLNKLNFRLGYLIFLSFYNKYEEDYHKYENNLFNLVFRLGFVHLLIERIKPMNKLIKTLCKEISESLNSEDCFNQLKNDMENLILEEKDKFIESLSEVDRFNNREHFVKLLFEIINLETGNKTSFSEELYVERVMPESYTEANYEFFGINEDNISKFANILGNLCIYNSEKDNLSTSFEKRIKELNSMSNVNLNPFFKEKEFEGIYSELNKYKDINVWSKDIIEQRTATLTKIAVELFINNKINIDLSFSME